jgi:hypothetical protein
MYQNFVALEPGEQIALLLALLSMLWVGFCLIRWNWEQVVAQVSFYDPMDSPKSIGDDQGQMLADTLRASKITQQQHDEARRQLGFPRPSPNR